MSIILNNINFLLSATFIDKYCNDTALNKNKLALLLYSDYSSALNQFKNGNMIFRGESMDSPLRSFYLRSPGTRISENTPNIYTMLMSEILPSWKDYPKRNKGVICSSCEQTAESFIGGINGSVYYIFPKNGAKIGICSADDLWNSFPYLENIFPETDLEGFCYSFIRFLSSILGINNYEIRETFDTNNTEESIELLDSATEAMKFDDAYSNEKCFSLIRNIFINASDTNTNITMLDILDKYMSPQNNGFQLTTIDNYNITSNICREVWTDSECIMIKKNKSNYTVLNKIANNEFLKKG